LLSKAEQGEIAHVRAKIMEDVERELFAQAIRRAGGNQAKAGRWLGVTRTTMREKLTHFGLHPAASQPGTTAP
jgi:DNA-binding protein Fis